MQGIVERRTTIPVLSHLLLRDRGRALHLAATDLDVSLTISVAAEVRGEGALAVQAKKFIEIVRSLVAEEIRLSARGRAVAAHLRPGRSRFRIHGLPAADFPTLPTVEGKAKLELPLAALPAPGRQDPLRGLERGVALPALRRAAQAQGQAVELVATDGHRLALDRRRRSATRAAVEDSVLVPRKALQELLRIEGDGNVAFRRGEHHLAFSVGGREMTCRVLEGSFPGLRAGDRARQRQEGGARAAARSPKRSGAWRS